MVDGRLPPRPRQGRPLGARDGDHGKVPELGVEGNELRQVQAAGSDVFNWVEYIPGDGRLHVAGRPIQTRSDDWRYRTGKLVRRNAGVVITRHAAMRCTGPVLVIDRRTFIDAFEQGFGRTIQSIAVVIVLGSVIAEALKHTGGIERITSSMIRWVGMGIILACWPPQPGVTAPLPSELSQRVDAVFAGHLS